MFVDFCDRSGTIPWYWFIAIPYKNGAQWNRNTLSGDEITKRAATPFTKQKLIIF